VQTAQKKKSLRRKALSRYIGASCRLCRREAIKLYLKGERCYTEKCGIEKRNYPPGSHVESRGKFLEYGLRLREKQKVRKIYGLSEKQFKRFFAMAENQKGVTGSNFLVVLERRLDNMVYRLGFATSRKEARQLVSHNHIMVNGKRVNISSYLVKEGDEVSVKNKDLVTVQNALESVVRRGVPSWIELDKEAMKGVIKLLPAREDITMPIKEQLIVEYYSR
jgi:small subunit ribosomal protein S4